MAITTGMGDSDSIGAEVSSERAGARRTIRQARLRTLNVLLWIVQIVLALLFLFAGGMKLALPAEALTKQLSFPVAFLRFIGVCEALGALGLVLPSLLRIRPGLTPLAAAGLVVIMVGAVAVTVATLGVLPAVFPFATGLLAALVAYGRWRVAPIASR